MSDATPLSPAELVVLRKPNLAAGLKAIKATLMLLLTKGVCASRKPKEPGCSAPKGGASAHRQ